MKAKDLKEKSDSELQEQLQQLEADLFQARLRNFTNQLDDTASIPRSRRDVARIKGELRRRELDALANQVKQALAAHASQESK